jgi:hypothetical protein
MLYIEQAQKTIKSKTVSLQQFLKIHLTVEGVIKRLLFIGLRINGVRYKTAQQAIAEYYEKDKTAIIKKAWNLCGIDYEKTVRKKPDYTTMENLVFEFSSKYRNQLIHGNDGAIHNQNLLKTLIQIDQKYIAAIEAVLKSQNKPSLFEQPRKWQLEKSVITDKNEVLKNLLGIKNPKDKTIMSLEEAQKQLSQVKLKI